MTATVHLLHARSPKVAGFLRVGHTGHRKLEALHAAGRFPFRRVVFDAARISEQLELLKLLRRSGCEIVLDPNFAEMAEVGTYGSAVSKLRWANSERPWESSDFGRGRNLDTAKAIAEFAMTHGVNAVLAPTHLLEAVEPWKSIDLRICESLRVELDRLKGNEIEIDYQLITTNALLREEHSREQLIAGIGDLPIENIWLRISGFGADATGPGTRHFVEAVRALHRIGRPLIGDYAGGYSGLAAIAFGATGGISHGVAQKEGFRASVWKRPSNGGGGVGQRIYVQELDRYFKEHQLKAIFAAKGGRSRFGCSDPSCCPDGIESMIENAHAHFLTQRSRQIDNLSDVPELRRAEHFLLRYLDPAIRSARFGNRLKIVDGKVAEAVNEAKSRLIRLRDALGDLHANEGEVTWSRPPSFRGRRPPLTAVGP